MYRSSTVLFHHNHSVYRPIIKDFSKIAQPLTLLTQKGVTYRWGEPQETALAAVDECHRFLLGGSRLQVADEAKIIFRKPVYII